MWEWLWWTGLITFSLLLIEALFVFDFILVLADLDHRASATLVWIRFLRFPPILEAYEQRLARQRYYTKQKFADPEATIRPTRRPPRRSAAAERRERLARMPIEIRRFGVGHRRPDGPPGTTGVTGPGHPLGRRGIDHRARLRARRAHRAARQPEHDVVRRHRGRRLGRRRRRADPGRGRRGRPVAGRRPARGLDRALRDAGDRRRVRRRR